MPSVFDPAYPPVRYSGNPIFDVTTAASWWAAQYTDPFILQNPWNGAEVLHYISGMALPTATGELKIGLFTGLPSDPYTWADQGVVLDKGASGQWDDGHVRLGSVVFNHETNELWLYYTGISGGTGQIGLAISTQAQNGRVWTKFAGNPIVTPTGNGRNDGTYVSEFAVLKESASTWTGIYAYRNGGTILPGYRYATSSDGQTWTKAGSGDILTTTPLYAEMHQLMAPIGSRYWLLYETGNDTVSFTLNLAYRDGDPRGTFTAYAGNPILVASGTPGAFDRYHVATGHLTSIFTEGWWELFYQGAGDHDQPYGTNHWGGGVAQMFPVSLAWRSV